MIFGTLGSEWMLEGIGAGVERLELAESFGARVVPPASAYDKNLTLAIGRCPVRSRLDDLCERQLRERFPIERIVTHRVPLRDAADAYEMFAARRDGAIKVVFEPPSR